jgi:hypothetical protein
MSHRPQGSEVVPPDAVVIGANLNSATGDLKHTLLLREDFDPGRLRRMLANVATMTVTTRRFSKLRVPPKKEGDAWRSFRGRLIVRDDRVTSSFDEDTTRSILSAVLGDFIEQLAAAVPNLEKSRSPEVSRSDVVRDAFGDPLDAPFVPGPFPVPRGPSATTVDADEDPS